MNEGINPLTDHDEDFDNTVIPESPPDGTYSMCLIKLETALSGKETTPREDREWLLKWTFLILGEEKPYSPVYKTTFIERTGMPRQIFKQELAKLGYKGKMSDLYHPEARAELVNLCFKAKQKTTTNENNPDFPYVNINISNKIEVENLDALLAAARGQTAQEDIPF